MGTVRRTHRLNKELIKNYSERCDMLKGTLVSLSVIMDSKNQEEAWVLYNHLDVFEAVDKLTQRVAETGHRIIEGRPFGPDTGAERPASKRTSK